MPPSAPDCARMTPSLGPFPPAWGFRICVPWTRGRKPWLLVETWAGPGLRWPTVFADILFLQRPPCWLLEPIHGTSSPPIQHHLDAEASSCCPKVSLDRRVSFVTSLSRCGVTVPSPLPNAYVPRLHLFLHFLPGKGLPQCTGQPVVREATPERGCHVTFVSHCYNPIMHSHRRQKHTQS